MALEMKILRQAHNKLQAFMHLVYSLFGQCPNFFFDAFLIHRFNLSHINYAFFGDIGFPFFKDNVARQFSELHCGSDGKHDDRVEIAVI